MKQHEKVGLCKIDLSSAPANVNDVGVQHSVQQSSQIAAWAANAEDGVGTLTHFYQVVGRASGAGEMEMREFRYRMPRALVDGSGNLAALNVKDAEVHVCSGNCGGECFITIADEQHDIR